MKKKYDKIIHNLPIGFSSHKIILDHNNKPIDYTFEHVNPMFEMFTGLKEKDVIGKTVLEVLPKLQNGDFDWIGYYGDIALNDKTGEFIAYSEPLERTYKCQVYSPEHLFFNVFFIDYSHGVLIENKLKEYTLLFDTAIKEAPFPIMIYKDNGEIMEISNRWSEVTGYTINEIPTIEAWVRNAYRPIDFSKMMTFFENIYNIDKKEHSGENMIRTKDLKLCYWDFYSTFLGINSSSQKIFMTVAIDLTILKEQETQINTLINYDRLTGLQNKETLIQRFESDSSINTIALIDIDNIGYINDLYGHDIGDLVIRKVASVLSKYVDVHNLYRWSGDEFILTLSFRDRVQLDNLFTIINKQFDKLFIFKNNKIQISISTGIVNDITNYSIRDIIKFADFAIYEVKTNGGNSFAYYNKQKQYQKEQIVEFDKLTKTMDFNREIQVFYQPRFSFENNQIAGLEALVRLYIDGEWILPYHFIQTAESNGSITALDYSVLKHVAKFQKQCFTNNLYIPIAVNVSPVTLTEGFVRFVTKMVDEGKIDPSYLELEITENVSLDISETLLSAYFKLKNLGIRFMLDDFGKHYSSLRNLTKVKFDAVKIDKDFVLNSEKTQHFGIIKASIELGHDLGMETIAEGIETIEQYNRIRELGCMYFQGFLYQKPTTGKEILKKYVKIPF